MTLRPGLVLGFPPVHRGVWGRRYTQRPSRRSGGARERRRVGAVHPTGISPDPQKTTPQRHIPKPHLCDDDDAAARTSPGVSPGIRRGVGEEVHPTPFKKE